LPGIEFSEEQQMKVEEIRKEFLPKLAENQKKWDKVITPEQVQARREALQKARSEGKEGRELQNAANAAIRLTDEQRQQRTAVQKERDELSAQIRTKLIALLTEEQRRTVRQPRQTQQGVRPTKSFNSLPCFTTPSEKMRAMIPTTASERRILPIRFGASISIWTTRILTSYTRRVRDIPMNAHILTSRSKLVSMRIAWTWGESASCQNRADFAPMWPNRRK
jgi:hypothetical protein